MVVLAIDPGLSGAFAWVTSEGFLIEVEDMPTIEVIVNNKKRRKVDASRVVEMMNRRPVTSVVVEAVMAMPNRLGNGEPVRMGSAHALTSGRGAGILEGVAAALGLPYGEVSPSVWKRRAGVPKDKGGARLMAQRTWPGAAGRFSRVKDDGRAEACLLGRWAALRG